ncbi:Ig-like domain-containing protein [Mycobacterium sp. EPa45]|uniref:Ig-like domain-containing protein n=1 Tax=Mycobacterium sp. EPa45 TaxID=1545728 RepID=UPI00069C6E19|nr:Ig-like domain-containing protein [Mycobacterium sp. EPa45]
MANSTAAATPLQTLQSMWSDLSRQLTYIFFNQTPTLSPTWYLPSGSGKTIRVDANGVSNNGYAVTYGVSTQPTHGTVTFDAATGTYRYTPRDELVTPGITDRFTITVDNGTAADLPGALGMLQQALHTIAVRLGVAKPDIVEREIVVTVPGTGYYGDRANDEWWDKQSYSNCTLMATAMAIGQVTGTKPEEADMVALAKTTASVVYPGRRMYLDEDIANGVAVKDAVQLMNTNPDFNVTASTKRYGVYDEAGNRISGATATDAQIALNDLAAALAAGNATMVTINTDSIWSTQPDYRTSATPNYTRANHEAVVIAVDLVNGTVYFNDSGPAYGKDMAVPIGAFLNGWQSNDYELTIVKAKPTTT